MKARHKRYIRNLERLRVEKLDALAKQLAEDVRFRDPFNDVKGPEKMLDVFRHLFENIEDVKFEVRDAVSKDSLLMMEWRFEGVLRGKPWSFDGMSLVRFADNGLVAEHFDYWDSGQHFFQRLPVIGIVITWLRAKLSIDRPSHVKQLPPTAP